MIDVHTHPCRLRDKEAYDHFLRTGTIPKRVLDTYLQAVDEVDKAVVLALWAPDSGIEASNQFVAAVVREAPSKLIGFASIDPQAHAAISELEAAVRENGFRGVKLGPIYQRFVPDDVDLWPLYERIQDLRIPIIWHQGASYLMADGSLENARPLLLDKVARSFPGIKMVIAHFGYPWSREVVALLRKHTNVFTDISALADRPWFLYNAIVDSMEYGAQDKILFGTDYPAFRAGEVVEALKKVQSFCTGTSLPPVPETVICGIIERNSLALLGID
jgi:predicted TIM-barrel fold metal-dependent hydrolase